MFDARLQPLMRRALDPLAARLAERGVSADAMTIGGFAVGVGGGGGAGARRLSDRASR